MEETHDSEVIKLAAVPRDTQVVEVNPPVVNDDDSNLMDTSQGVSKSRAEKKAEEPRQIRFTYMLENWLEREERKLFSNWHELDGFKWRMLIFPRGNGDDAYQTLSIYIECSCVNPSSDAIDSDSKSPSTDRSNLYSRTTSIDSVKNRQVSSSLYPLGWKRPAAFYLVLRHPSCPRDQEADALNSIEKDTEHIFSENSSHWGFQNFAKFADIRRGGFVDERGALRIEATIKLVEKITDPYSADWDSKKETGFVGLKNQGATCYMNSLLQTLYMLGEFRRAVFNMPLPDDDSNKADISFALQKLFHELQVSPVVVKTKKLTESFGWDTTDAFTQHDAQELNRILCDHLEEKLKKSKRPNTIAELFEGKLLNYIECVDVEYKSTREESFYDLSLNVKGCRNIYDSFDKYTEVEMMDGDNKYRAEGFSELQKARKGVKFTSLPPVLQLHLKRFEYDFHRDAMVKINDRYEFSKELELSKYVEKSDGTDVYLLHSVLVHIGDVNGGHYYAFIRPVFEDDAGKPGTWFKFDDDHVKKATAEDAIQSNFGAGGEGDDDLAMNGTNNTLYNGQMPLNPVLQPRLRSHHQKFRFSNAYMLQYVRKNAAARVLRDTVEDDIPKELIERITREREEEERRRKERAEQHLYVQFKIATDRHLGIHTGDDLVHFEDLEPERVKRTMTLGDLKAWLENSNLIRDARYARVWRCAKRDNETIRPYFLLADGSDSMMVTDSLKNGDRLSYTPFHHYSTRALTGYTTPVENLYVEDLKSRYAFGIDGQGTDSRLLRDSPVTNMDIVDSPYSPTRNGTRSPLSEGKEKHNSVQEEKGGNRSGLGLADDEHLIFFKLYVPTPCPQLRFLGHAIMSKSTGISEVKKKVLPKIIRTFNKNDSEGLNVDPVGKFRVWEEISCSKQTELSDSQTLNDIGLQYNSLFGGDILVFQPCQKGSEHSLTGGVGRVQSAYNPQLPLGGRALHCAKGYFQYLRLSVKVEFRDKDEVAKPGLTLEILRSDSYEGVREVLASALEGTVDPNRLRFFAHDGIRDAPRSEATHLRDDDNINQMLSPHFRISTIDDTKIIWYEHTEYDIREFDGKEEVRVTWRPDCGVPGDSLCKDSVLSEKGTDIEMEDARVEKDTVTEESNEKEETGNGATPAPAKESSRTFSVLVPTLSRYGDVLEQVRLKTKVGKNTPLRLLQIKNSKISHILDENDYTQKHLDLTYDFGMELRAEPVPKTQTKTSLGSKAMLVPVVHMSKDKPRARRAPMYFGVPFLLRVEKLGERVGDLKERIRTSLGVKEKEFSTWKLGEVRMAKIDPLEDDDAIWVPNSDSLKLEWNSLALEHKSNAPIKRMNIYSRFADKPLKIRS